MAKRRKSTVTSSGSDHFETVDMPPLASLRAVLAESAMQDTGTLPPMAAGLFGYFGYDMIRHIETIPNNNPASLDAPDQISCARH